MDLVGLLVRVVLVFGLLALVLWFVRRTEAGRRLGRGDQPLQVLCSTRLGKGSSIALVRIGGASYALGVTEHTVTLLTPVDQTDVQAPATASTAGRLPWTRRTALAAPVLRSAVTGQPASTATLLSRRPADQRPTFAAALQQQVALLGRRPSVPEQRLSDEDLVGPR